MQIDITSLTPEAHEAIVECLRIAARRGRQLREVRERAVVHMTALQSHQTAEVNKNECSQSASLLLNDGHLNSHESYGNATTINLGMSEQNPEDI